MLADPVDALSVSSTAFLPVSPARMPPRPASPLLPVYQNLLPATLLQQIIHTMVHRYQIEYFVES